MRILYLPNAYSQQRQYEKKANVYPVLLAMEAEWYRKQGHEVYWDVQNKFSDIPNIKIAWNFYDKVIEKPEGLPFLSLPHPDRKLTKWWEYQDNGNFKYKPATYIQSANGCWWGKCSFCVENGKVYEMRPVDDVIDEIIECYSLGFREVFDDSGTFPIDDWLDKFCHKLHNAQLFFTDTEGRKHFNFKISCNMRMVDIDYFLLRQVGFRMLLFGLESANQETLDKINKGMKTDKNIIYLIKASRAGLEPHIAVMFGYPWETDKDAINTLKLVWWLLKKGYAKTAQASFYDPPDKLINLCHRKYVSKIYDIWKSPQFWFNQIRDIHNKDDLKYLWKKIKVGLWH